MIPLANVVPQGELSWRVLATLLAVLLLSGFTFAVLVRRWTIDRDRFALSDWAKAKGFRLHNPASAPPLVGIASRPLRAVNYLTGPGTTFLELESDQDRWHVLLRQISTDWKPTALRPVHEKRILLDLYSLSSYPTMGNTERFMIFGTDTATARTLSKSHARALLPPDIGLLLHGQHLILDFSTRPFDPIEFDRMLALVDQLVVHLPPPA